MKEQKNVNKMSKIIEEVAIKMSKATCLGYFYDPKKPDVLVNKVEEDKRA